MPGGPFHIRGAQRRGQRRVHLRVGTAAPGYQPRSAGPHRGRRVGVVAGEQPQAPRRRRVRGQVARGRPAELGPGQASRGSHRSEHVRRNTHAGPFGKNIGVELKIGRGLPDTAEVGDQLVGPRGQVVGRDGRDPRRPERRRGPRQPGGVPRVRRADVRDDPVRARLVQRQLDQRQPLGVVQGRELARGPRHQQAVQQPGDELVQGAIGTGIDLSVAAEQRRHGRENDEGWAHRSPCDLKNAVDSGRHSRNTAPRPTSQVRTGNTRPIAVFGALNTPNRSSVARQNSTVDKVRAQFLPWLFARAIHSHRAIPITPDTMATLMMNLSYWLIWAAVQLGLAFLIAALRPPTSASVTTRLTVLTAAPTYMSLTAFITGGGAGSRSSSTGLPLDG